MESIVRVPVCNRADYRIAFEQILADDKSQHTFIHAEFSRWSARVRRKFRKDLDDLFEKHGGPWHVVTVVPHAGDVEKHRRFCATMGFHFNTMVPCQDGTDRPIYTRKT